MKMMKRKMRLRKRPKPARNSTAQKRTESNNIAALSQRHSRKLRERREMTFQTTSALVSYLLK